MNRIWFKGLGKLGLSNRPDFLIIGAQKSGTSGLYFTLKKHPQVISSIKKEIHYFDNDSWFKKNNLKEYHRYFPGSLNFKKKFDVLKLHLPIFTIPRFHTDYGDIIEI